MRSSIVLFALCTLALSACSSGKTDSGDGKPSAGPGDESPSSALAIFNKRILPIFNSPKPSSCTECHLSGVDLKDYIQTSQGNTFASLVAAGLINPQQPDDSKILTFIARKPDKPNLITDKVRTQELAAFRAWIHAAVKDKQLVAGKSSQPAGPGVPIEVVRHARKDRVLASFLDNIWTEVARCTGCHSPDLNQKQVKEHGEQVSWIKPRDPQATLDHLVEADLIDAKKPAQSMILLKPTMQVEHGGGQKMVVGDRTYRQFRRFLDDYAALKANKYKTSADLPRQNDEVSVATSMTSGIWFKLTDVPARFDKKLLQVDLYRREGKGWSKTRWATADRSVFGKGKLWQQTLSLTAPRGSARAKENQSGNLPSGEYLAKIYIDAKSKLGKDSSTGLSKEELVGQVVVRSHWRKGYGRMTVARFPTSKTGIQVGDKVPEFTVQLLGRNFTLSQLRNTRSLTRNGTIVLTFWCSFCDSCRSIDKELDSLAKRYKGRAAVFALNASAGETAKRVSEFKFKHKLSLPVVLNPNGSAADVFGANKTTTTVIIDGKGVLRYFGQFQDRQHKFAEDALQEVLAGKPVRIKKTRQKG